MKKVRTLIVLALALCLLCAGIAQAHGVSSAQVIIRWHLQAGNICIPGSSNEQHIIEDYDVWDFALTEDEMAQMTALERDDRFADY